MTRTGEPYAFVGFARPREDETMADTSMSELAEQVAWLYGDELAEHAGCAS